MNITGLSHPPLSQPAHPSVPESMDASDAPGLAPAPTDLEPQSFPPDAEMLSRLDAFFSGYLSCSEEQRVVLILWILHTHCFAAAATTPYLNVYSTENRSGKTICLRLLSLLCPSPWLAAAVPSSLLIRGITAQRPTLLLDQVETILGAAYSKLKGLLLNGAIRGGTYSVSDAGKAPVRHLDVFCPKVFAGNMPLPGELADLCIPIALLPHYAPLKFRFEQARETARPLLDWLRRWAAENLEALATVAPINFEEGPDEEFLGDYGPSRQDCAEPLLHVAGRLGGEWPLQARAALASIFKEHCINVRIFVIQLLADIRDVFDLHPHDRISTTELLESLNILDSRPWSTWNKGKPMNARNLAYLLHQASIHSRNQRHNSESRGWGYDKKNFSIAWRMWLYKHDQRLVALGERLPDPPVEDEDQYEDEVEDEDEDGAIYP